MLWPSRPGSRSSRSGCGVRAARTASRAIEPRRTDSTSRTGRAAAAAAYPARMNEAVAKVLMSSAAGVEATRATMDAMAVQGGRVADGPRLTPSIRRHVDAARNTPPAFAFLRNNGQ
eukprot:105129-Pleurochrysis_carterae.AAC.3